MNGCELGSYNLGFRVSVYVIWGGLYVVIVKNQTENNMGNHVDTGSRRALHGYDYEHYHAGYMCNYSAGHLKQTKTLR